MTFYETIEVGRTDELGTHRFTAEDIKRFAAKYDPQPFHLDEQAAEGTLLGALCASGWHTAATFMRLVVEHRRREVEDAAARGMAAPELGPSPGVKNLGWPRPVFAGDTLTYRQTVTAKRVSEKRPGWAVVETHVEATNQNGDVAFSMDGAMFIGTD